MRVTGAEFVKSATRPAEFPPADVPEIALAGRSNVGKSSSINTLLARKNLAVTSRTPGRTRLVNFFDVNLQLASGQKARALRFVDLPGYGFAKAPREEQKEWRHRVDGYVRERESLVTVIHLVDLRHDLSPLDLGLTDWLRELGRPEVLVFTKSDKLSRNQQRTRAGILERASGMEPGTGILFSSHTGQGKEDVWKRIAAAAFPHQPGAGRP